MNSAACIDDGSSAGTPMQPACMEDALLQAMLAHPGLFFGKGGKKDAFCGEIIDRLAMHALLCRGQALDTLVRAGWRINESYASPKDRAHVLVRLLRAWELARVYDRPHDRLEEVTARALKAGACVRDPNTDQAGLLAEMVAQMIEYARHDQAEAALQVAQALQCMIEAGLPIQARGSTMFFMHGLLELRFDPDWPIGHKARDVVHGALESLLGHCTPSDHLRLGRLLLDEDQVDVDGHATQQGLPWLAGWQVERGLESCAAHSARLAARRQLDDLARKLQAIVQGDRIRRAATSAAQARLAGHAGGMMPGAPGQDAIV